MNESVNLVLNTALGAELSPEEAGELSALMNLRDLAD